MQHLLHFYIVSLLAAVVPSEGLFVANDQPFDKADLVFREEPVLVQCEVGAAVFCEALPRHERGRLELKHGEAFQRVRVGMAHNPELLRQGRRNRADLVGHLLVRPHGDEVAVTVAGPDGVAIAVGTAVCMVHISESSRRRRPRGVGGEVVGGDLVVEEVDLEECRPWHGL